LIAHLAWDLDSNVVEADSGVGGVDESGISSDNTVVDSLGNGDVGDNGLGDSWDGIGVVDKWGADNRVDSWDSVAVEESWISLGLSLSIVDCGSNCVDNWGVDSVNTSICDSRDSVGNGVDSGDGVCDWGVDSLEGGSWGQGRDEWGADDGVNWSVNSTGGVDESWVSLGFSISRSLAISPSGGVSIWSVGSIGIWSVSTVSVDSIESISLWLSISRSLAISPCSISIWSVGIWSVSRVSVVSVSIISVESISLWLSFSVSLSIVNCWVSVDAGCDSADNWGMDTMDSGVVNMGDSINNWNVVDAGDWGVDSSSVEELGVGFRLSAMAMAARARNEHLHVC